MLSFTNESLELLLLDLTGDFKVYIDGYQLYPGKNIDKYDHEVTLLVPKSRKLRLDYETTAVTVTLIFVHNHNQSWGLYVEDTKFLSEAKELNIQLPEILKSLIGSTSGSYA